MMNLTLTVDLVSDNGGGAKREKYGCLFVEQSPMQAYLISALDKNIHGQLNDDEKNDYINQLIFDGFVKLRKRDVESTTRRPKKYFIILDAEEDWNIKEILVMNKFHDHPELLKIVEELGMSEWSHHLLVDKWPTIKKIINKRGNLQINHGYNHMDMTDETVIDGMNVARCHMKAKRITPGLNGDENVEESLLRMQMINTRIMDYITDYFGLDRVFAPWKRRKLFSGQMMIDRGHDCNAFKADAGSFNYTGILPERVEGRHSSQTSFHGDVHNDPREEGGANKNFCFNQLIEMYFPRRREAVIGRCALLQFMKACNGNVLEKYDKTMNLLDMVRDYMQSSGVDINHPAKVDWVSKLQEVFSTTMDKGLDYATLPADADKDCNYSWHVHVIFNELIPFFGWNIYILTEALYCLSLTPSSIGWRQGCRYAMRAHGNGLNFVTNFVQELVFFHGAVSHLFHHKARHQVSSGGTLSNHDWCASCKNALGLWGKASNKDCVSKELYDDMGSHPFNRVRNRMRGLRNVSDITAHNIVNIATKISVITNTDHIRRVTIARKTETAKRLARIGIRTDAHLREVVHILSRELAIEDYQIVENLICETLRWMEGGGTDRFTGVDTVALNQPLYKFIRGVLMKFSCDGGVSRVDLGKIRSAPVIREYNPRYRWWIVDVDDPVRSLGKDHDLVLTKKSKRYREYLSREL